MAFYCSLISCIVCEREEFSQNKIKLVIEGETYFYSKISIKDKGCVCLNVYRVNTIFQNKIIT